MLKIPSKVSVILSMCLSVILFAGCIYFAFIIPNEVNTFIDLPDIMGNRNEITEVGRTILTVAAYLALGIVMLADALLFALLLRVRKGQVFTFTSVALIRGVSWCCYLLSLCACIAAIYFQYAFAVVFLAFFLGLCLRVVKNVIEEATLIKRENDLTV